MVLDGLADRCELLDRARRDVERRIAHRMVQVDGRVVPDAAARPAAKQGPTEVSAERSEALIIKSPSSTVERSRVASLC